ncbi:hypothetical protein [Maribellus sp. YY47]|uniref:hypothetical protein n=1 Tax=Maribellus sp. YY47 TaxID=2929486 RepID=UPI002000CF6D|nr:hypothetical protein [Maribellus sp. YY47]MCK3684237.1 hypothetical protein [Maribellus sp. YY47]
MITQIEIIDFEKVFEGENSEDYLKKIEDIPKRLLVEVASYFVSANPDNELVKDYKHFLSKLFGKENNKLANEINDKIVEYKKEKSKNVGILNPRTSLKLFETVLTQNQEDIEISDKDLEILIFKIYLALNTQLNKNDNLIIESTKKFSQYPDLICLAIGNSLPISDISNYNLKSVFVGQILKAIFLFEFLSTQDSSQTLLENFYARFRVTDYKGFLQKIFPIAFFVISAKHEGSMTLEVKKDENYESNIDFLDNLVVSKIDYVDNDIDYLTLRANPLYKLSDTSYRVISPLFAIEKIFNGLYFLLKEINDAFDKTSQIKLRQLITFEFSEKYLLYKIIERTYEKKYFKLSGEQMKTPGAPDYYIRNGNKVFLFESKDILIRADIKESYDFEQYERALKEKLYFETNGKKESPKAVRQLTNFAKSLLNGNFNEDKNYKPNSIRIYPIILLHNRQLDILGLNNLINIWFELEKDEIEKTGLSTKNFRKPTIIHIDTLLVMHEQLASGKYQLDELLDEYQNVINGNQMKKKKFKTEQEMMQAVQDQLASFNMFFDIKYGWTLPSLFEEKGIEIAEKPSA